MLSYPILLYPILSYTNYVFFRERFVCNTADMKNALHFDQHNSVDEDQWRGSETGDSRSPYRNSAIHSNGEKLQLQLQRHEICWIVITWLT